MSLESWTSLAERVEKAGGADREIDGDVFQLARGSRWDRAYRHAQEPCGCAHDMAVEEARLRSPRLSGSVDAVLALISETLPGWAWGVSAEPPVHGVKYHGFVGTHFPEVGKPDRTWSGEYVATPALALLSAYCRARAASVIEIAGEPT